MYKTLKSQLIINNVAILAIFGSILFFLFNNSLIEQRNGIRDSFQINSDKISNSLSQNFYTYYHNIQAISKNSVLKAKNFDESNFLFNELVSLYPVYDFILLTDLEGNYIASNSIDHSGKNLNIDSLKTQNFSNRNWFKDSKDGKFTEDLKKKIFGSRFGKFSKSSIASSIYKKEKLGFHISTQVQDEYGDALAVLTTFVSSKWIEKEISSLSQTLERQGMKGAKVEVLDGSNKVIGATGGVEVLSEISIEDKKLIDEKDSYKSLGTLEKLFLKNKPLVAYTQIENSSFISGLGWKTFVMASSEEAFSAVESSKMIFSFSLIIALIFVSLFTYYISHKLSIKMENVSKQVTLGSVEVHNATDGISEQAYLLFDSTTDQAASLQETVSSLTEISAMVSKNTAHSQNSKELSNLSRNSANSGVDTIKDMLHSIEQIAETNQDIVTQMNENSKEMTDIIKVISNIEEKTKVINDIVFQTKLLSFNASVEAARAGEHGKGFSVVAEEVGNLAKTSGEAAKEIEDLLNQSIGQVENIVKTNKVKVEELVDTGVEKINTGKNVAQKCKNALEEILTQSVELDQAIEDIASASIEQSKGIDEIAKAMEQLDVVTKKNSEIAKVVSKGTDSLKHQSVELKSVSNDLSCIVHGKLDHPGHVNTNMYKASNVSEKKDETKEETNIIKLEKFQEKSETLVAEKVPMKKVSGADFVLESSDDEWEDL